MRAVTTLLSLTLAAPVAFADGPAAPLPVRRPAAVVQAPPAVTLTPIVVDDTPERCRSLAKRANAPSVTQGLSARIALAGCVAEAAMQPLSLIDGEESVLAVEEAVKPGFELLDLVVDKGDASAKIMALRAKADLYTQMSAKMMNTVPPPANTSAEAAALRETRRQIVDGMVQPWRDRQREAHQQIIGLNRAHPELIKNPVVQTAVRDSERQLAQLGQPVASR
ncbi:hypothetical protein BH11MYX3_BH11MYX3_27270 [soil metagenome]